ncbi:MAG TPA: dTDP-4-dehydrorhamnose reductase [Desulfosporosinus sp.]|nr:dTDP-4-dehydrorhamnose reductase [Desulfosporosinus sp.]
MKILVVGSNGQLGKEIAKQFQSKHELELYDIPALDITDYVSVVSLISDTKPAVVINAAAYTNVERAEEDVDNAYRVNALGAHNLALACHKSGVKLVHISTDYVFDGTATLPYEEFDPTNPLSVYGKSKLWGEKLVEQVGGQYYILRTSWLYGDGPNFVRTMLKLAEQRDQLRVVADQFGTPTYTKDLVWVLERLIQTEFYGLYNVSNQGSCSWQQFACKIFAMAGKTVQVDPVTTAEYPTKAARPLYSVMDNKLLRLRGLDVMRPWEEALQDYMDQEGQSTQQKDGGALL